MSDGGGGKKIVIPSGSEGSSVPVSWLAATMTVEKILAYGMTSLFPPSSVLPPSSG